VGFLFRCYSDPYAETLLGEPLRPPMPFGPFPVRLSSSIAPAVVAVAARGEHRAPRF